MFERLGVGDDRARLRFGQHHRVHAAKPLDHGAGDGGAVQRGEVRHLPAAIAREPGEQPIELVRRIAQRQQHVVAERGLVGVQLRITRQQAELARQVLDVVHDEGDAAVEIVEAARLFERVLAGLLGEVAGELLADDAQQVEVLPVELALPGWRGEHDDAGQPLEVEQRHQRPGACLAPQPFGHDGILAVRGAPRANILDIDDESPALEETRLRGGHRVRRHVRRRPLPARGERQVAGLVGHQQQPGRAVGDIGHRLDHSLLERGVRAPTLADRAVEAQPFAAIVVAVLEQVLGDHDLQPAPQPGRGQRDQRERAGQRQEAQFHHPREIAAGMGQPLRDGEHRQQVGADQHQRDALERDGARGPQAQRFALATGPGRQQQSRRHRDETAQRGQLVGPAIGEIGDRIEVEIEAPQDGERQRRPAQRGARRGRGAEIEIVHQHQRAHRDQQAEQDRDL